MALPKGHEKMGGREKGTPNKTTSEVREAYRMLVESHQQHFALWLRQVARQDPYKAMDLMIRISEYFIPKLARTDMKHEFEDKVEGFKIEVKRNRDDT